MGVILWTRSPYDFNGGYDGAGNGVALFCVQDIRGQYIYFNIIRVLLGSTPIIRWGVPININSLH